MNCLFAMERINFDRLQGDSVNGKRLVEALAQLGNEVSAVAHGKAQGVEVVSPWKFSIYSNARSRRYADRLALEAVESALRKKRFDCLVSKLFLHFPSGSLWDKLPALWKKSREPFEEKVLEKASYNGIPYISLLDGITEKNSFPSFFMGNTREAHLELLKKAGGIIALSDAQIKILRNEGIGGEATTWPSPVDTSLFFPAQNREKLRKKFGLNEATVLYSSPYSGKRELLELFECLPDEFNVAVTGNADNRTRKFLARKGFLERTKFFGFLPLRQYIELINACDAGAYLKRFGYPLGDASYMMKISECLASGRPVIVPDMAGPKQQAGEAGIELRKGMQLSEGKLEKLGRIARKKAVKELDLKKNAEKIESFLRALAEEKKNPERF